MTLTLRIIGYYEHNNFGDEQYKTSMCELFRTALQVPHTTEFLNCDKIHLHTFSDTDIIVLGGGDVLNPYFLDKIHAVFTNRPNLIIALSVGLPYTSTLIETTRLQIIDYIFIRTTQDLMIFNRYFSPERTFYIPDVSYILTPNYKFTKSITDETNSPVDVSYSEFLKLYATDTSPNTMTIRPDYSVTRDTIRSRKGSGYRILGICLSRHFYNAKHQDEYQRVVTGIAEFVKTQTKRNTTVVFVPYNTKPNNRSENDTIIAADVITALGGDVNDHSVINITYTLTHDEMNYLFSMFDLCIPMRFHSVLYCMYNMIPFVPVYTTRKIHNLLLETDWDWRYSLPKNERSVPTDFSCEVLTEQVLKLMSVDEFRQNIYHKLLHINTNLFGRMFFKGVKRLVEVITGGKKPRSGSVGGVLEIIENTHAAAQSFAESRGYPDWRSVSDSDTRDIITGIVSFNLIGLVSSDYTWGIRTKMFDLTTDYDYRAEWKWIINDYANKDHRKIWSNPNGLFNMEYMDQVDRSGAHRSGWQYVYKHIESLHNESSDLLLDLYIDRSFHWNRNVNKILNVIPYRQNWIGFVHHTFDTTFSDYNCDNLLRCPEFIESLRYCRGIFVLSDYLRDQFRQRLDSMGFADVQVYSIVHPTETDVKPFSYTKFFHNEDKRLVHIGGWLRNVYSFYDLVLPEYTCCKWGFVKGDRTLTPYKHSNDRISKYALVGKAMNNYYPDPNLITNIQITLEQTERRARGIDIDQNQHQYQQNCSQHQHQNQQNCSQHQQACSQHQQACSQHQNQHQNQQNCSQHQQNCSQHQQNCSQNQHHQQACSQHQQNCSQHQQISTNAGVCIYNNWSRHFVDDLTRKLESIRKINYLENSEYDELMTKNIVFINLVDASAVNTIIECIVRNTPIIVNRHASVVELLGEKYPLYFTQTDDYQIQIHRLLRDDRLIRKAHKYLQRLDKRKFQIGTFVKTFEQILRQIKS